MTQYDTFIKRNSGYLSKTVQDKIKNTKVLIAGCGIGSTIAEALLRAGFINLTLVDFDMVEFSNLNRQIFNYKDIGENKAVALKNRLISIYPKAKIKTHKKPLSKKNLASFIKKNDLILDTIDFLDLQAILDLHKECEIQKKPLISMVSAGFGAIGFLIDKEKDFLKNKMEISNGENVSKNEYGVYLAKLIKTFEPHMDKNVLSVMNDVMDKLSNGIPCPAPHLSVGAFAAASLASFLAIKFIENRNTELKNKTHFFSLEKALA